ncbi:hypothetical protein [Micromonospora sagamiensis]|uniref:Uncharacterized protein n=1 Tax=Micromonospora sagamiensis TaxID=47875 RepID=A0A562WJR6_9ACTN|nr:hypothetical protein [Micromonospora sagamiensis]TWJ30445.1 hypothetical protein JD81_03985 [Micromonospora sagamiensis]BCL16524.1 hypothetical protein GCM10017556_42630 [Micromonospora sagamiensis]
MPADPTDAVLGGLVARLLDTWLTGALRRSRRVTLALVYAGPPGDSAETVLRAVATAADRVRGQRLTVVVLAEDPGLPARLAPLAAGLPAEVTVHPVPGTPDRLPVVLKAAGAAGTPLLTVLADPAGQVLDTPAGRGLLAAATGGRPADLLLATGTGRAGGAVEAGTARAAVSRFPLVAEVETVPVGDAPPWLFALGTNSDRNLEAFKDAIWRAGAAAGLRHRDVDGTPRDLDAEPDPSALSDLLRAELDRCGPRTVTELRRHVLTGTPYRAVDALRALTVLLDAGTVTRSPADGRLAGDVIVQPAPGDTGAH